MSGASKSFHILALISCTMFSLQASAHRHSHARALFERGTKRIALSSEPRVIQCVAFAKQAAGMDISGNARDWWNNAAGIYERGSQPESGSVLSFEENGRMPLGHVAVVSGLRDKRTIIIDQSHWNSRGITRDVEVQDVSDDNDWSAVRVQLGHGAGFGSIYRTHGFIYPRPDRGTLTANVTHAPLPLEDGERADLRKIRAVRQVVSTEIAEAPERGKGLDLTIHGLSFDAPSRALR